MTQLQQAIFHAINVVAAIVAIVVLQATGNLTVEVGGLILAVTGFSAVGLASITPNAPPKASPVPAPAPAKPVAPGP